MCLSQLSYQGFACIRVAIISPRKLQVCTRLQPNAGGSAHKNLHLYAVAECSLKFSQRSTQQSIDKVDHTEIHQSMRLANALCASSILF